MSLFKLTANHWYAWEMLPGYGDCRYCSPVRVEKVAPLKTGNNILRLDFYNAFYAEGVRGFCKDLKVLHRGREFLFARLIETGGADLDRCALITNISVSWLAAICPGLVARCSLTATSGIEQLERALDNVLE